MEVTHRRSGREDFHQLQACQKICHGRDTKLQEGRRPHKPLTELRQRQSRLRGVVVRTSVYVAHAIRTQRYIIELTWQPSHRT